MRTRKESQREIMLSKILTQSYAKRSFFHHLIVRFGANQNKTKKKQKKPVNMGKEVYVKTVILIIFFKYYELFIPYSASPPI